MPVTNRLLRGALAEVEGFGITTRPCLRALLREGFVERGELVRVGQGEEQLYRVTELGRQFVQAYDVGRHLLRRPRDGVEAELERAARRLGLVPA